MAADEPWGQPEARKRASTGSTWSSVVVLVVVRGTTYWNPALCRRSWSGRLSRAWAANLDKRGAGLKE